MLRPEKPFTAVQSCGADPAKFASILKTFEMLYATENPGAKETAEADVTEVEQAEDWGSIAELPEWKQLCIKSYYACKARGWTGKCDDCLRYREGQHEWPTSRCGPRKKKQSSCAHNGEAMECLDADLDALWHQIRELDNRVARGEPLELSERVRDLLLRAAPTVAIESTDAVAALAGPESATALLRKLRERVREGSNRINNALLRMYALQDAGDLEGARQQMQDVLAVEGVPLYREIAEGEIEKLDDLT